VCRVAACDRPVATTTLRRRAARRAVVRQAALGDFDLDKVITGTNVYLGA
jgi:hypothetical protein